MIVRPVDGDSGGIKEVYVVEFIFVLWLSSNKIRQQSVIHLRN